MTPAPLLPDRVAACLFDLDGVLTETAKVHAQAWKRMFDAFLREHAETTGQPFVPFELPRDYTAFVDGKLREDGVRAFLASRQILLPEGLPGDSATTRTVHGLARRKNDLVVELIRKQGVDVYPTSVRFVEATRAAGLARAVVSASKNCKEVLTAAGIQHLFTVRIDGVVAAQENLRGKPAPDMFLRAAAALQVEPDRSAVFEDAEAGVEAARVGEFGYVVGVDRTGHEAALRSRGADVVVQDLAELLRDR